MLCLGLFGIIISGDLFNIFLCFLSLLIIIEDLKINR